MDERAAGAQAKQIQTFIVDRFGGEIARVGVAIAAAAIVLGAAIGVLASGLVAARRKIGGLPPSSDPQRWAWVLGWSVGLHASLELWGMARAPQLYADAWYAQGGWRRTVQVVITDRLGPTGVLLFALLACAAFVAGPPSSWWRWRARLLGVVRARGPWTMGGAAALALGWTLTHIPSASARPSDDPHPNVILLAADSLRADHLVPRTAPYLSALAAKGTLFERAYVSLPRTFPSWVSFLTGRHPHHHGIRSMFPRWEERAHDFDALPERLARAGHATAVVSDYAGDIFSRINLGFDTVDVPEFDFRQLVRQRALERETPLLPVLHSRLGRAAFPVLREMNNAADPDMLARDATEVMRRLEGRGKPFLLVVFFSTAHFPYAAPSPYYRRFADADYRGRYKYDKPVGLGREAPADARDQEQVRALYDGAVLAIDDAAQSIVDAADNDGIGKRTVVVVTADHGETLYDHGHGQGHGDHLLGDEGTHVPLVVVDPRIAPAERLNTVSAIVRDVDLAPTLYALADIAPPSDLDGQSLVPALHGGAPPHALAYAETGLWFTEDIPALPPELRLPYPDIAHLTEVDAQHGDELVLRKNVRAMTLVAKHRMVRDERWKLLYVPTRTGVRWLLFDTQADPGETQEVAAAHPDVLARLQGEMWAWMTRDHDMTERGGYLVPREGVGKAGPEVDVGGMRLEDAVTGEPPGHAPPYTAAKAECTSSSDVWPIQSFNPYVDFETERVGPSQDGESTWEVEPRWIRTRRVFGPRMGRQRYFGASFS